MERIQLKMMNGINHYPLVKDCHATSINDGKFIQFCYEYEGRDHVRRASIG
eukprot:CAMPEP_0168618610 /NCGR_PEP_ID=MMETSP0449_2-20121227/6161_1 /TAXON_ID=1082188 /ORGANISM="Strombidium rassoulzadegani, Strain ras09" /LENGTH=50 /DNA_ID=CAMNT_0008659491 /DNA_START=440 /DNA_END=592 /DNA_ORIENTATION=-